MNLEIYVEISELRIWCLEVNITVEEILKGIRSIL